MKLTFLIGNGFDIAIASKLGISKTRYTDMYDWNKGHEFDEIEQRENKLVKSIYATDLWSSFEDGLISYFNNIRDKVEVIDFFKDKDQFCEYICDYLKQFYESKASEESSVDSCKGEFSESVLGFIDRMDSADKEKIINFIMSKCNCNETIHIDFINFNGTNTLERLRDNLKSEEELLFKCGAKTFKVVLDNLHYTHSKLDGKTENYHKYAFGTTAVGHINPKISIPTSFCNLLNKTNYSFDEWIKDTDLFITHGLSFGESDEYYWDKIAEKIDSGSMLVDFPFVTKAEKRSKNAMNEIENQRISRIVGYNNIPKQAGRIIISCLSSFKPQQDSSGIFSF
ncbi:hypothetical protein HMPREF1579_01175 [Gardnerella vaginalis JCP8066]|nr:hypothetical protein HMPREF1579_01175 [Gardnerella vaginalis JCP8066]